MSQNVQKISSDSGAYQHRMLRQLPARWEVTPLLVRQRGNPLARWLLRALCLRQNTTHIPSQPKLLSHFPWTPGTARAIHLMFSSQVTQDRIPPIVSKIPLPTTPTRPLCYKTHKQLIQIWKWLVLAPRIEPLPSQMGSHSTNQPNRPPPPEWLRWAFHISQGTTEWHVTDQQCEAAH